MRTRTRLAWSILLALVLSLTATSPAVADPGRDKGKPIRPTAAEYDGGSYSTSTNTSGGSFVCVNESRNPHNSAHQPGFVNAEGYTSCTAPAFTTLQSKLYKEFAWLWWSELASNFASGYGTVNVFVNAACQGNLNYRIKTWHTTAGTVQGTVTTANVQYVQCQ